MAVFAPRPARHLKQFRPELANRWRERKIDNIGKVEPAVIVAGTFGYTIQIVADIAMPVVPAIEFAGQPEGRCPAGLIGQD